MSIDDNGGNPSIEEKESIGSEDMQDMGDKGGGEADDEGRNPNSEDGDNLHSNGGRTGVSFAEGRRKLLFSSDVDEYIAAVDGHCRKVAIKATMLWASMVIVSYIVGYATDRLEKLEGVESLFPGVAAFVLLVSIIFNIIPYTFTNKEGDGFSGVLICAFTVQGIAFVTDLLLSAAKVPVFIDPVMGTRVFMLRWSEWTPLAYIMTFLTEMCQHESMNVEDEKVMHEKEGLLQSIMNVMNYKEPSQLDQEKVTQNLTSPKKAFLDERLKPAYDLALSQAISTFCGYLFPFCPEDGLVMWSILFFISTAAFSLIFFRYNTRRKRFRHLIKGDSIGEKEMYGWAEISLQLLKTCAAMWTVLVLSYTFYTVGPKLFPEKAVFRIEGLNMMCECVLDVLFKSIYLSTVQHVHNIIFDPFARAERRLEELRQMMSVVWDNSSDVIGISARASSGYVTTILSPTYLKMFTDDKNDRERSALAFDLDPSVFIEERGSTSTESHKAIHPTIIYNVKIGSRSSAASRKSCYGTTTSSSKDILLVSCFVDLVVRAWKSQNDVSLLTHDLVRTKGKKQIPVRCEAKITKMDPNALVVVVRDISERFKRFEAEKKVISETTARLKDAAANRFTRHEVKNGLLAAIGLCDSLRESNPAADLSATDLRCMDRSNMQRYLFELDKTLHEVLDTVLAEAMARDVIHKVYEPKLERVNVPKLLDANLERFPLKTIPVPVPDFALDPQLLKYIHRNAVSNACKYGKPGGEVLTELLWDENEEILQMTVSNLPGEGHDQILRLGEYASQLVFSPRKRLSVHTNVTVNNNASASHSSGDGAWIMHNCAMTLGGSCDIKFEKEKTIFRCRCPVTLYEKNSENSSVNEFKLPTNTYAIGIDDSSFQRKILRRYFMLAGVPEERIRIMGDGASELTGFEDWVINFVDEHPNDFILTLIDENLDLSDEISNKHATISGSLCVSNIRKRLLPDQEKKLLFLMRSANDSASDIAIYNSRAHGFLQKTPLKGRKGVLEVLAPIWMKRFHHSFAAQGESEKHIDITRTFDDAEMVSLFEDIKTNISDIDTLVHKQEDEVKNDWSIISEKLHSLRGDLLIMPSNEMILGVATAIDNLRGVEPSNRSKEEWKDIRSNIEHLIA